MTKDEIRKAVTGIEIRKGKLHRPLTLLYVLGQCFHGNSRLTYFKDINDDLSTFIAKNLGSTPKPNTAKDPFWLLKDNNEMLWERKNEKSVGKLSNEKIPRPSLSNALKSSWQSGFTLPVYRTITLDRAFLLELITLLINEFCPEKHLQLLHDLDIPDLLTEKEKFFRQVFTNYEYSCAICEYPDSLKEDIELHVAYIKPSFEGGPQEFDNNISMCVKHRELFHFGAFSLEPNCSVVLAKTRFAGIKELAIYEGKTILLPDQIECRPNTDYLKWHNAMVLR